MSIVRFVFYFNKFRETDAIIRGDFCATKIQAHDLDVRFSLFKYPILTYPLLRRKI